MKKKPKEKKSGMSKGLKTTLIVFGSIIGLIILFFVGMFFYFFFAEIGRVHVSSCDTEITETLSMEEFEQIQANYYKSPNPEIVVPLINSFEESGVLQTNAFGPSAAFFSRIFADNPDKLEGWIMKDLCGLNNRPVSTFDMVTTALWMTNSPEAIVILKSLKETTQVPDGKEYIERYLSREAKDLKTMNVTTSLDLDMLWSAFFATGDGAYIEQVISVLPLRESDVVDEALFGSAAKWSLQSNYENHPKIKEVCDLNPICKDELFTGDEEIKDQKLREYIESKSVN